MFSKSFWFADAYTGMLKRLTTVKAFDEVLHSEHPGVQ